MHLWEYNSFLGGAGAFGGDRPRSLAPSRAACTARQKETNKRKLSVNLFICFTLYYIMLPVHPCSPCDLGSTPCSTARSRVAAMACASCSTVTVVAASRRASSACPAARLAAARHPRPPSPPPTRQQCSPLASRTNSQSGSRLSLTDDERLTIGGAPTDVQRPRRSQTVLARSVGRGTPPSASFHAHSRNRRTSGERHPRLDPRARRRRPCLAACRLANSLVSKH